MDRAVERVEGRVLRAVGDPDLELDPIDPAAVAGADPDRRRSASLEGATDQLVDLAAAALVLDDPGMAGDVVVEAARSRGMLAIEDRREPDRVGAADVHRQAGVRKVAVVADEVVELDDPRRRG